MVVGPQENVTLAKMESGAGPELWGAARRGQAVVRCCGSLGRRRTEDGGPEGGRLLLATRVPGKGGAGSEETAAGR